MAIQIPVAPIILIVKDITDNDKVILSPLDLNNKIQKLTNTYDKNLQ
jgi:hypothetical protein